MVDGERKVDEKDAAEGEERDGLFGWRVGRERGGRE